MTTLTRQQLLNDTLASSLDPDSQFLLRRLVVDYDLSHEEVRKLAENARDLEMWREQSLAAWWEAAEEELHSRSVAVKSNLLERLDRHMRALRESEKVYPTQTLRGRPPRRPVLARRPEPAPIMQLCPNFSKHTNCCGLFTIDAVTGCVLGCTFCPLGTFYGDTVEFTTDLAYQLSLVHLEPDRFYHVGTGQIADSLIWGNKHGILDALLDFARKHPNVMLELKTKSDRVDYLLAQQDLPRNIVCSWLINTSTIARNEEHGCAPVGRRLQAARLLADRGCRVGFHIHPIIAYRGWRAEYGSLAGQLMSNFSPEEVDFVSLAAISFAPSVVRDIRRRGGETKVLQMPLVADPQGKLTYPASKRIELFEEIYRHFQPWRNRVFVYLCMETDEVWRAVTGGVEKIQPRLAKIFGWKHTQAA